MIREYRPDDHEEVMELWLFGNMNVHDFIPVKYWKNNFTEVSRIMEIASVYVWEEKGHILGFVEAMETMVMGLFVAKEARKRSIGRALLDVLKMQQEELTLLVYEKNPKAIRFFMREGFKVQSEQIDEATKEKEILLRWTKSSLK